MKRIWFVTVLIVFGFNVKAQQLPQYTQYILNPLLVNPAVSGIENYTDIKTGYRSQWTGLQGAPINSYFTITTPLGRNFVDGDVLQVPLDGDNPIGQSFVRSYRAAQPHHGIGLTVFTSKAGPIRQTAVSGSYAYHIGISSDVNLAAGVSGGITNINLNTSQVALENPLDPAIYNGNNSQIKPNINAGLWAYSASYFVGASVLQLLPQTLNFAQNSAYNATGKTVAHYYFTAGVKFFLSDDVSLMPSVMYKITQPAPSTFDLNLKMAFRDHFWIGGSYRESDAVAGMMGFTFNSFLSLAYSYDYTTSNLNMVSTGTHELVLGFYLNNKGGSGPRRSF